MTSVPLEAGVMFYGVILGVVFQPYCPPSEDVENRQAQYP
jgi:hypothetical protein